MSAATIPKIVQNDSNDLHNVNQKMFGEKAEHVFSRIAAMVIDNSIDLSGNIFESSSASGKPASRTKSGIRFMYINSTEEAPKCPCI
jgi:hypothetical protein